MLISINKIQSLLILSLIIMLLITLVGCASGPTKFMPDAKYKLSGKLEKAIKIYTLGGSSYKARQTTMMMAGNVFVTVPKEKTSEETASNISRGLRFMHGKSLEKIFNENKVFLSSEYVGDEPENENYQTFLKVTFLKVYQGEDGWPLEIEAHYILQDDSEILLDKKYSVTTNSASALLNCSNCLPSYVALEKLNQLVLADINTAIGGHMFEKVSQKNNR
ncbi:hypothetical protein [Aliikangiella maris]|uniref:ABC-type transport auxiliary lipoprotein component domain-containing protein n=2 Tax=Aliikangiella maris TaxID=3162458 RepID=A0ABV2BX20_9GAMM